MAPGPAGRDIRSQLRLINAAAEQLTANENQDQGLVLDMTLDMLAAVIAGRDLKPTVDYVTRYCDVYDSQAEAEQIAADIEALGGEAS